MKMIAMTTKLTILIIIATTMKESKRLNEVSNQHDIHKSTSLE